jgi:hypothetical protein
MIYALKFDHYDKLGFVRYDLHIIETNRIIMRAVTYTQGYGWCINNLDDDDIYEEYMRDGAAYFSCTGKELRKANEGMEEWFKQNE